MLTHCTSRKCFIAGFAAHFASRTKRDGLRNRDLYIVMRKKEMGKPSSFASRANVFSDGSHSFFSNFEIDLWDIPIAFPSSVWVCPLSLRATASALPFILGFSFLPSCLVDSLCKRDWTSNRATLLAFFWLQSSERCFSLLEEKSFPR